MEMGERRNEQAKKLEGTHSGLKPERGKNPSRGDELIFLFSCYNRFVAISTYCYKICNFPISFFIGFS